MTTLNKYTRENLDPIEILQKAVYGILIIMTCTMAVRGLQAEYVSDETAAQAVRGLFLAAIGCAIAWGLIDAVIYVLACEGERNESQRMLRLVQKSASDDAAAELTEMHMGPVVKRLATDAERARLAHEVVSRVQILDPKPQGIRRDDIVGATALFLVALSATLPVIIPLALVRDPFLAVRAANVLSLIVLFIIGYNSGRYVGTKPLQSGLSIMLTGLVAVIVAIPLGG